MSQPGPARGALSACGIAIAALDHAKMALPDRHQMMFIPPGRRSIADRGKACHFDGNHEVVILDGATVTVKVAVDGIVEMVSPRSRRSAAYVAPWSYRVSPFDCTRKRSVRSSFGPARDTPFGTELGSLWGIRPDWKISHFQLLCSIFGSVLEKAVWLLIFPNPPVEL